MNKHIENAKATVKFAQRAFDGLNGVPDFAMCMMYLLYAKDLIMAEYKAYTKDNAEAGNEIEVFYDSIIAVIDSFFSCESIKTLFKLIAE